MYHLLYDFNYIIHVTKYLYNNNFIRMIMRKVVYTSAILSLLVIGALPYVAAQIQPAPPPLQIPPCFPEKDHEEDTSGYYLNVSPSSVMPGDTVTAIAGSITADPKTLRITIVWYDNNGSIVHHQHFYAGTHYDYNFPYSVTSTYTVPDNAQPNTTWYVLACFEYDDGFSEQFRWDIRLGSFMVVPEFLLGSIGLIASMLGIFYAYKVRRRQVR